MLSSTGYYKKGNASLIKQVAVLVLPESPALDQSLGGSPVQATPGINTP